MLNNERRGVVFMLHEKDMGEFLPTAYTDDPNGSITLQNFQSLLSQKAQQVGLPIAFDLDEVKSGGLFNKVVESCLVVYHPEHRKDYFNFCIRVSHEGNRAYVYFSQFGESAQIKKENIADANREARRGQSLAFKMGNMVASGLRTMGRNKAKLEAEQRYYSELSDLFESALA